MNKIFIFGMKEVNMKKVLPFIAFVLLCSVGFGQQMTKNYTYGIEFNRSANDSTFYFPTGCGAPTDSSFLRSYGVNRAGQVLKMAAKYYDSCGHNEYTWDPASKSWKLGSADSSRFVTYYSGDQRYVMIQTLPPTAGISGGYGYERKAPGKFYATLSWSAGRQAATTSSSATANLSSITINGTAQTFTNPAAGSSYSSSYSDSVTNNTTTVYSISVTTTDGKSASASTAFYAFDKRYLGWSSSTSPTQTEILAAIYQDNSGNNSSLSYTLSQLSSDKYLFFVTTSTVSSVSVNGFPSTASFTLNTPVTFTNASGGTFNGYVTVSKNAFGSTSTNSVIFN